MSIKKVVTTRYLGGGELEGFEFTHEPIEDSLTIKKTKAGFEARYLVQDNEQVDPQEGDGGVFLVNYHRDFEVRSDKEITEDEVREYYQTGKTAKEKEYYFFPLACLIHSGVRLQLGSRVEPDFYGGWDTSRVGVVLVKKDEVSMQKDPAKKAQELAAGLVETWNSVLAGDVYGIVVEHFDKDKKQLDENSSWQYIGYKYAIEALKTEI